MKKLTLAAIVLTLCILTGCSLLSDGGGAANPSSAPVYVEDYNGKLVPAFDDVEKSSFDPSLFYRAENGRIQYSDPNISTMTGIDVSAFQEDIDWEAVKNDGIDFVMIRCGFRGYGESGVLNEDDNFKKNCEGAHDAGLEVGAYFFSQAKNPAEAVEEAQYVLGLVEGMHLSFPIAYDWEHIGDAESRTADMTVESITPCAIAFCNAIRQAGYEPIIYFNADHGYFNYDLTQLRDYKFWMAEFKDRPSFYYDYKIWQYSEKGTVAGIDEVVDLNIALHEFVVG